MKKISIVFSCVLVLSMLFLISTTAASNIEIDYSYYDTSAIDFSLTEEDNFIPDSLTIVLKKQYSGGFKRWDKFDFARIKNFDYELDDLTADTSVYSEAIEKKVFRKIIRIDLPGFTKRMVIELGKLLQKLDFVYSIMPNVPGNKPNDVVAPLEETLKSINGILETTQTSQNIYDLTTNDPMINNQTFLSYSGVRKAWNYSAGFTSQPVYVGVCDTGISNHPDLVNNIVQGYDFGNDRPTYYDLYDGENHGTGVAGVIGAVGNNGVGISGVNMNVKLVPMIVYDNSNCLLDALVYAQSNNIKILNVSLFFTMSESSIISMTQPFANYSGLVVCAAGNESLNLSQTQTYFPQCVPAENIICVGSSALNNSPSDFTNYSTTHVDLMAIGERVLTTNINDSGGFDYSKWEGTSLSSPLVAGVASLLLSYNPSLTTAQIKQYILSTVTTTSTLASYCVTGGVLNALAAIQAVPQRSQVKNVLIPIKITSGSVRRTIFFLDYNPFTTNFAGYVIPDDLSNELEYIVRERPYENRVLINCTAKATDDTIPLNTVFVYLKFDTQYDYVPVKNAFGYTKLSTLPVAANDSLRLNINPRLIGDVDGTNTIVANDALLILQHANGNGSLPSSVLINADVNMDGQINAVDAQLTLQYVTGRLVSFW